MQHLTPELLELMKLSVPDADRIRMHVGSMLARVPDRAEQIRIWNIAKRERTPGMRQLKVEELIAPHVAAASQSRVHRRKPSDHAERLFRNLHASETLVAFMDKLTKADLKAFVSYAGTANDGKDILRRVDKVLGGWQKFQERVRQAAQQAA